jgi:hypothetical protein
MRSDYPLSKAIMPNNSSRTMTKRLLPQNFLRETWGLVC